MSGSPAPVLIADAIFTRIIYTILLARQGDFEPQKILAKEIPEMANYPRKHGK